MPTAGPRMSPNAPQLTRRSFFFAYISELGIGSMSVPVRQPVSIQSEGLGLQIAIRLIENSLPAIVAGYGIPDALIVL